MFEETNHEIIVLNHVEPAVEEVGRKTLEEHAAFQHEFLRSVDNQEKKDSLHIDQINSFMGSQLDKNFLFLVKKTERDRLLKSGLGNSESDGYYQPIGNIIVIYYADQEPLVSIEERVVHEMLHQSGIKNTVIDQLNGQNQVTALATSRRLGFSLEVDKPFHGNNKPGDLLEEMVASYAGLAYVRTYADAEYYNVLDNIFASGNLDNLIEQLGREYTILNADMKPAVVPSLFAYLFDKLRIKLGVDDTHSYQDIVQFAVNSRRNVEEIRRFIANLEDKLAKVLMLKCGILTYLVQ